MQLCILFISGVAGQTSCPEVGRWSEYQDGELQPRRRPTGSLQRGAWWWGPAFLRGGLIVGPYWEGTGLLICLASCPGPALGLEPMLQDPGERLSAWGQEKGSSWTALTLSSDSAREDKTAGWIKLKVIVLKTWTFLYLEMLLSNSNRLFWQADAENLLWQVHTCCPVQNNIIWSSYQLYLQGCASCVLVKMVIEYFCMTFFSVYLKQNALNWPPKLVIGSLNRITETTVS